MLGINLPFACIGGGMYGSAVSRDRGCQQLLKNKCKVAGDEVEFKSAVAPWGPRNHCRKGINSSGGESESNECDSRWGIERTRDALHIYYIEISSNLLVLSPRTCQREWSVKDDRKVLVFRKKIVKGKQTSAGISQHERKESVTRATVAQMSNNRRVGYGGQLGPNTIQRPIVQQVAQNGCRHE